MDYQLQETYTVLEKEQILSVKLPPALSNHSAFSTWVCGRKP